MSLKRKIIIGSFTSLITIVAVVVVFGYWFIGLIKEDLSFTKDIENTLPSDLVYLSKDSVQHRGKILAVVTSQATMGTSGKPTGYELSELARAYYVFTANGFEVEIASPKGGNAPIVIDDDDMWKYEFAFTNDPVAQLKTQETFRIDKVNPNEYEAVYFVGGKGAMYDLPDNTLIQALVAQYYEEGKVIGAVCHGPAALVNVTLKDGRSLLEGKLVSSFTNTEELFLIPEAPEIFPFMLQDKMVEQGATFKEGAMYLENVVQENNLITGQNPWSTWLVAESIIEQLGYKPKPREKTPEENAIQILKKYEDLGYQNALVQLETFNVNKKPVQRELIAVHGILAVMKFEIGKAFNLIRLLTHLQA